MTPILAGLAIVLLLLPDLALAVVYTDSLTNDGSIDPGTGGATSGDPGNQKPDEICDPDVDRLSDSNECKELKSEDVSEDVMNAYFDTLKNAASQGIEADPEKTIQAIQDGKIHTGQVIDTKGNVQTISPGSFISDTSNTQDLPATNWSWYKDVISNTNSQNDTPVSETNKSQGSIGIDQLLGGNGIDKLDPNQLEGKPDTDADNYYQSDTYEGTFDNNTATDKSDETPIKTGSGFLPGHLKEDAQYSRATELDYQELFKATDGKVDDWSKEGKLDQKIAIEAGMVGLAQGADLSKTEIKGVKPADIEKYGYIDPAFQTGVNVDPSLLTNKTKYNNAAFVKMLDKKIAPELFTGNVAQRQQVGMSYFVNVTERYTPNQAAAIMGNLTHESGGKLDPLQDAFGRENSTGVAQWNAAVGRRQSLESYAGQKFTGFKKDHWADGPGGMTQLGFVDAELQGISPVIDGGAVKAGKAFAANPNMSLSEATEIFQNNFEAPKDKVSTLGNRTKYAKVALNNFTSLNGNNSGQINPATATQQPGGAPGTSPIQISIPKTGIKAVDDAVSQLLKGGNPLSALGNLGGITQSLQGLAGTIQNLFGGGKNSGGNSGDTKQQPYTDLKTVIQSDLTSKATLAQATSTHGYRFWGSMKREFINNGNTDSYNGSSINNKLLIDHYCDESINGETKFNIPYSSLAASNNDVIIASQMTITVPGLHCFAFEVDTNNQVPESDESNNVSNWREFTVEFEPSATSTADGSLPVTFEAAVYNNDGVLTTEWTNEDLTVSKGDQLAFRWDAPGYDSCTPYLSLVSADFNGNLSPNERNTMNEGVDIQEHTGYYELNCALSDKTITKVIYVTVNGS